MTASDTPMGPTYEWSFIGHVANVEMKTQDGKKCGRATVDAPHIDTLVQALRRAENEYLEALAATNVIDATFATRLVEACQFRECSDGTMFIIEFQHKGGDFTRLGFDNGLAEPLIDAIVRSQQKLRAIRDDQKH